LISGIKDHDIKDVEIKDSKFYFNGNGTDEQAKRDVPELEKGYPEPGSFGILPAYGIYVRHANNIKLEDIELQLINNDQRPAISMDNVTIASLVFVNAKNNTNMPLIVQKYSSQINIFRSLNLPGEELK